MSETRPPSTHALDRGFLRTMCGDDPEFEREIVAEFMGLAEQMLAEISDAIRSGDAKRLFEAAHSLKGSSRSLGAAPLGELCERLESAGREGRTVGPEALERLRIEYARVESETRAIVSPPGDSAAA